MFIIWRGFKNRRFLCLITNIHLVHIQKAMTAVLQYNDRMYLGQTQQAVQYSWHTTGKNLKCHAFLTNMIGFVGHLIILLLLNKYRVAGIALELQVVRSPIVPTVNKCIRQYANVPIAGGCLIIEIHDAVLVAYQTHQLKNCMEVALACCL